MAAAAVAAAAVAAVVAAAVVAAVAAAAAAVVVPISVVILGLRSLQRKHFEHRIIDRGVIGVCDRGEMR